MIALLVMHDGRDHIYQTIPSADAYLKGPIDERYIHCDGPDVDVDKLRRIFPTYTVIPPAPERQGFAGAIRRAWQYLRDYSAAPYIFHLEDDFTFRRPIDLVDMALILERNPHLVNIALRRQPWNEHEAAAGGIIEQHPHAYHERYAGSKEPWLEHRQFFTTNPGLYRHELVTTHEWPAGAESEGRFSHQLLGEDRDLRFGYYGARDSGEWVNHIGNSRTGTGY